MHKFLIAILSFFPLHCIAANFEEYMTPPETYIDGRVTADYPNLWWEWSFSFTKNISPARDLTGENCHQGQEGSVWFLAGGYGTSKIKRKCEIPEGKFIFFPVINMVYWKPKNGYLSCEKAKEYAALNNDTAISIEIELDSMKAINPAHTRIASNQCFNIFSRVPEGKRYNAYPSATDGFWVMLNPLPKGTHNLKFKAMYDRKNGSFGRMAQDIEYEIIVN